MLELAASMLALWAINGLLVPVLSISPNPLWLPVLVFAIVYGKGPGIAAALSASAIALVNGNGLAPGGDFYAIGLSALSDPILWLLAGLGLGEARDRWQQRYTDLEAENEKLRVQRSAIADYATVLREHVDRLEFAIATANARPRADTDAADGTRAEDTAMTEDRPRPTPSLLQVEEGRR